MKNTFKIIALMSAGIIGLSTPANAQVSQMSQALDENLYFDFNKATQTAETLEKLKNITSLVTACGGSQVLNLTGHTDSVGSSAFNQGLSERRSIKIKDLLVSMGVPESIIRTSGAGETSPLMDLGDNVEQELNRRVNANLQQDSSCLFTQPTEFTQQQPTEFVQQQPTQFVQQQPTEFVQQQPTQFTQTVTQPTTTVSAPTPTVTTPAVTTPAVTASVPATPVAASIPAPVATTSAGGIFGTGIPVVAGLGALGALGGITAIVADGDDDEDDTPNSP